MEFLATYNLTDLGWIALSLLLTAMSKGGFPVGSIATPLLILLWPGQAQAARAAVAFMLPMLCVMDAGAVVLYRRHVDWQRVRAMLPGTLVGVTLAAALFISDRHTLIVVTDATLRIAIGTLGLLFTLWFAARKWILSRLTGTAAPGPKACFAYGATAGITSSLAHAAAPVMQMVLLPQKLPKMRFAATNCAYFFVLNLIKLVPFVLLGRIQPDHLRLGLVMLPVIPVGVLAGYALVRFTRDHHYAAIIHIALAITSVVLIINGLRA
ncbi:MAG TPA: hypothetical protein DCS43_14480 [Verrucomicrobia bacterium]|nr:hypothetical protein [Verrucomicrobiota bacterium]